jgi:uncharacterized membrane protein
MARKSTFKKIIGHLWSLFLSGLLTILPLTLTIVLFHTAFNLVARWLIPVRAFVPSSLIKAIPYAEIIIIILGIFLLGTLLKIFFVQPIINFIESLIFKIPLVRPIYSGIKQLVNAFSPQDKHSFKQVVLIEFPRKGTYSIGFLTSELPREILPGHSEILCNVFIPTTPNPTTGFFIVLPQSEIQVIDLTRQEAMAMIISGGIILPERFLAEK